MPSFSTMGVVLSLSLNISLISAQLPSVSNQSRRACFLKMYVDRMNMMLVVVVWADSICRNTNFVASGELRLHMWCSYLRWEHCEKLPHACNHHPRMQWLDFPNCIRWEYGGSSTQIWKVTQIYINRVRTNTPYRGKPTRLYVTRQTLRWGLAIIHALTTMSLATVNP